MHTRYKVKAKTKNRLELHGNSVNICISAQNPRISTKKIAKLRQGSLGLSTRIIFTMDTLPSLEIPNRLTLFTDAGYETTGYEKVRVRNVWHPKGECSDPDAGRASTWVVARECDGGNRMRPPAMRL